MNKVSIVSCPDYSGTKKAIAQALALLGGIENIIDPGDRVLLKPNILSASPPEAATTTHPSVVTAMCEFVLSAGGKPVVGDGAGISRPGATAKALQASGIEEAARKAGAGVVNFETAGFTLVDVPEPLQFRKLYIANPVLEADVVISLPKLKTHELTYYTGAVKNFFGALPGVWGMEGNGPSHGKPVNSGVILASPDCVSLDIVAAELIGFDPLKIPTTAGALKKGFGNQCPVVVGTPLKEIKTKFKPSSGGVSTAPAFLKRSLGKYYTINPIINQIKCTQCGACYMNCSPEAVERLKEGGFRINPEKCILCYCCRELCPNNAVEIKKSLLAQFLTGAEDFIHRK